MTSSNQRDDTRIVVTGMGVICPLGQSTEEFWQGALAGRNGIVEISRFDTSTIRTHRGGEIRGFAPEKYLPAARIAQVGRASHLAIGAVSMALEQSGAELSSCNPYRLGVSFGTTMGEPGVFDEIVESIVAEGASQVPAPLWIRLPSYKISGNVASQFGFRGPNFQIPTACTAGNHAIGYAFDLLRMGRVDLMVAGGSDAFSRIAFAGFNKLRAAAPEKCAPFDKNRKGMMVGEGAAALVLERLTDAKKRKAPILAEILGYGLGCDASKMTIPHPRGGRIALRKALASAQINPEDIGYISAHGTGTKENDRTETTLIKEVLGDHAYRVPVSSVKSMIGHCMGASSAIEAVLCTLALQHQILPPTIHYEEPDPECDLDYVPNEARPHSLQIAVSNAYAFGGNCSSLVLKKFA